MPRLVMRGREAVGRSGKLPLLTARRACQAAGLAAAVLIGPGCTSMCQWVRSGFKVGPNYCPPQAPVADDWVARDQQSVFAAPAEDHAWWTVFRDPTLDGLIDTAYQQNLDLAAATARIMEARARRSIAVGNLFPQSQQAIAAYAHGQVSQNLGIPTPSSVNFWADGFNASWELDFWGRLRRNIEASNANLDAAVEAYGNSLVMLLSEVATNYVQLRTFEQRLAFARENVEIQRKSLELVQLRHDVGTVTALDLHQAKASL